MNIRAVCHTNLDGYSCYVTQFLALPRIGDRVQVNQFKGYGMGATLKVVGITHCQDSNNNPYIEVELHHGNKTSLL